MIIIYYQVCKMKLVRVRENEIEREKTNPLDEGGMRYPFITNSKNIFVFHLLLRQWLYPRQNDVNEQKYEIIMVEEMKNSFNLNH